MSSSTQMDVDIEYPREPKLESRFRTTPLEALRPSARRQISLLMDIPQDIIHEEIGMLTDWRGLAELVGFSHTEMLKMERTKSPTNDLLSDWELNYNPTIGHFWSYMLALKRHDVLMECKSLIERDALSYIHTKERLSNDYIPLQEDTITSTSPEVKDQYVDETKLLTIHDALNRENPIIYDAFVCYNEKSENDSAFVKQSIQQLEHSHGLQLCIPSRDCLAGGAKYVMDAELIKSRCRRMVIVISNDFLHSSACDFQVKFAHSLAPGARKKRLIPVLMEERLKIPDILRHVTICDFTKPDLMEWFWDRLASSIKAPLDCDEIIDCNPQYEHLPSKFAEKTPEKITNHKPSWSFFPKRTPSSDSNSSGFSLVSVESLPEDIQGTNGSKQTHNISDINVNASAKRQHETHYVSFEDIIPCKKEQKSKTKRIFELFQNKLGKNK